MEIEVSDTVDSTFSAVTITSSIRLLPSSSSAIAGRTIEIAAIKPTDNRNILFLPRFPAQNGRKYI